MAKKKFTAINRILTKAKPLTYIEPGTAFMMEGDAGDKLVALGAASHGGAADAKSDTAKKAVTKKTVAEKTSANADSGDDDLV